MLFFFNDTATTEIYTLSLHDALPISRAPVMRLATNSPTVADFDKITRASFCRSEEHTSELQSQSNLVCRLLLEKKNVSSPIEGTKGSPTSITLATAACSTTSLSHSLY